MLALQLHTRVIPGESVQIMPVGVVAGLPSRMPLSASKHTPVPTAIILAPARYWRAKPIHRTGQCR